jgi:threonine dehydratase
VSRIVQGEGLVGLPEIEAAARRLQGIAIPTPLIFADSVAEEVDAKVHVKYESLQRAGSFKIRGAYNFVSQLSDEQVGAGLVTYSSGNHGQAVALAGKLRRVRTVVVVPTTTPKVKRDGVGRLGGELVFEGTTSLERKAKAYELAEREGLVVVPPFDHRHIIAGQGTVGLEIARDWPDVDVVLVPVGGGGLVSGVAAAVKRVLPKTRVIGVEPEGSASMRLALDNGSPAPLPEIETICDGLAPVMAGLLTFEHVRALVDDVITVSDEAVRRATAQLIMRQKAVVEFSGAAAVAAMLSGRLDVGGQRVAAIVSGGNMDPAIMSGLI